MKIRHLVVKPGDQELPRYYWQPSAALRQQGWLPRRIPDNWRDLADPTLLEAAAIGAAQALNAELDAARQARPTPPAPVMGAGARTVDALIKAYRASEDFTELAASTRRGYQQCLDRIGDKFGRFNVLAINASHVEGWKRRMKATPAFANAVLRVLRLVFAFGRRKGWLKSNPAEDFKLLPVDVGGLVWPREAVAAFVAAADKLGRHSIGTAVMLNEWMGQRQGDVLRLPRSIMTLRQRKTDAGVVLPIDMVPELAARLEAELARQTERFKDAAVQPTSLIIDEQTGQRYSADSFRHRFAEIRAEAAKEHPTFPIDYLMPGRNADDPDAMTVKMTELWFQHLRHTAVTRLAEADCDVSLISAITGHSPKSLEIIIDTYMVKTRKLARLAFQKRLDAEAPPAPAKKDKDEGATG